MLTAAQRRLLDMFRLLTTRRQAGFGAPQPIPLSEMCALLDEMGFRDPDFRWEAIQVLILVDSDEIAAWARRRKGQTSDG